MTIFAARRVFPPLLITPANASKPFMKLTGPEAIPPPESVSLLPRSDEKFVPVPEPHLNSIPSVRVSPMIDSMLSCTELIKHAEHCGFGCTPTLNHTGELKLIFCSTSKCVNSSRNASRASCEAKYPPSWPQRTIVLATRPINCRTEPSRSLVPGFPWKYLLVTMFVAVCDQLLGTSTSSWRKIVTPFSLAISAVRFSHSTSSNGDFFPSVKYRSKTRPVPAPPAVLAAAASVAGDFPLNACFTVAIRSSAPPGSPPTCGEPYYFTPLRPVVLPRASLPGLGGSSRSAIQWIRETCQRKKNRSLCDRFQLTAEQSHLRSSAKRQCSARGWWLALSPTEVLRRKYGRGAGTSRSVFFA